MTGSARLGRCARHLLAGVRTSERDQQDLLAAVDRFKARLVRLLYDQPAARTRLAGVRHHLLDVEVVPAPARPWPRPSRRYAGTARIRIYDYDADLLLEFFLELPSGRLTAVTGRVRARPPLARSEVAEALDLLRAADRLGPLAEAGRCVLVPRVSRAAVTAGHPRWGHRLYTFFFWSATDRPVRLGQASVDLSAREVVGVREAEAVGRWEIRP
ncbi:hypothetical protein AB0H57_22110 [Micromonospora sp. NPDC050686]|uniref:hypothetical protein n=1 Tax=Micromonospora sp. NPDC050686 TaxID=3154631 RepID=UPI0033D4FEF4